MTNESPDEDREPEVDSRQPQPHRTVDRVTQILELVVYHPGMSYADLARALGAPKSSVYGFMQGMLARGWLYEQDRGFYLGPAVYGLVLASGHLRAGAVSYEDLLALHEETGVAAFLGVSAGDHLIYVAEAGSDSISEIEARRNIRRTLLGTAAGKVLLAARPMDDLQVFLQRHSRKEAELVEAFLGEYEEIKQTGIATNTRLNGTRYAIAALVPNRSAGAPSAVVLVGRTADLKPRKKKLADLLRSRIETWSRQHRVAREAI